MYDQVDNYHNDVIIRHVLPAQDNEKSLPGLPEWQASIDDPLAGSAPVRPGHHLGSNIPRPNQIETLVIRIEPLSKSIRKLLK